MKNFDFIDIIELGENYIVRYKWKDKVATLLSIKGLRHIYYCDGYLPGWYLYDYNYIRAVDKDIKKFNGCCYILLSDSIDHHKINGEYWKRCDTLMETE